MNEQRQPVTNDGTNSVNTTTVEQRQPKPQKTSVAARLVRLVAGVIITVIALRFVLILLGANAGSGFVNFIYDVSRPLVSPFFNVFNYDEQLGQATFEIASLVAIVVYGLVAYGLSRLLRVNRPSKQTV